jgi:hypothetical protein
MVEQGVAMWRQVRLGEVDDLPESLRDDGADSKKEGARS